MRHFLSVLFIIFVTLHAAPVPSHPQTHDNVASSSASLAVLAENFPDPAIIEVEGFWYAFATTGNGYNIQVAASWTNIWPDWQLQTDIEDPLPDPGPWTDANAPNVWAPDVVVLNDGTYVLYYAATTNSSKTTHCVGAATSQNILGPYLPQDEPLACDVDVGGAIDPAGFVDPKTGARYIVYKIDGNSLDPQTSPCGAPGPDGFEPTPIMVQEVSCEDGVTPVGEPFEILDRGEADGPLVEAPNLTYHRETGLYFLTFSSNCYSTEWYDIGYAYSTELNSTFVKASQPLMTTSSGSIRAPGGLDTTPDGSVGVFHGSVAADGNGEPIRYMFAMQVDASEQLLSVAKLL